MVSCILPIRILFHAVWVCTFAVPHARINITVDHRSSTWQIASNVFWDLITQLTFLIEVSSRRSLEINCLSHFQQKNMKCRNKFSFVTQVNLKPNIFNWSFGISTILDGNSFSTAYRKIDFPRVRRKSSNDASIPVRTIRNSSLASAAFMAFVTCLFKR